MNTCKPFNNNTITNFIDMFICYDNKKFSVIGLKNTFNAVTLGTFEFVLDAYGCALQHGFELYEYEVAISPFENKIVKFTLD